MKSNELRALIVRTLRPIGLKHGAQVGYRNMVDDKLFPHIVFDFVSVTHPDFFRSDYTVDIDIFTKNQQDALDIADEIDETFRLLNEPGERILPTFYTESRQTIEDPDRTIKRELIRLSVQTYDKE